MALLRKRALKSKSGVAGATEAVAVVETDTEVRDPWDEVLL